MKNTPQPLITVVIPVYNRAEVVGRTLEAISRQTATCFRVILVNNNSTDGTADVLRRWAEGRSADVTVLCCKRPGAAAARQCGLDAVDTPWTLFFDSDDTMAPEHIEQIVNTITSHPDAEMIGRDVRFHHPDGRCRIKPFASSQYSSLFDGTTGTQRYCARTELFRRAGGWNPDIGVWDDIELGARLLSLKPVVVKIKGKPTVDIYLGSDSISNGETAGNIDVLDRALNAIGATLGPQYDTWIALKRIIIAANSRNEAGKALYHKVISQARRHRMLLRAAYIYTRAGGRGAAKLLRPFI